MRLALPTIFVLIAFAGNSVLTRLALNSGSIGPWSFSLLRFFSGALILLILAKPAASWNAGRWTAALALCAYGVFFSFAYLKLSTGTGALILFAVVQVTMLLIAFSRGERMRPLQWIGLGLAALGLVYLLSPGLEAPSLTGALMMAASGIGWGVYSILGKSKTTENVDPIAQTSGNFARAAILLIAATPILFWISPEFQPAPNGIMLAILSGAVTSGLGYALWYRVLKNLTVTTAAVSQLTVPVFAAIGGAIFVFEPVTPPFAISCAVVLLGVGLATIQVSRTTQD